MTDIFGLAGFAAAQSNAAVLSGNGSTAQKQALQGAIDGAGGRTLLNLIPLRNAFSQKTRPRIVFCGDSILENNNQNPRHAGLPYIFERRFREIFSEFDNPEFVDCSLGGRDAYHLAGDSYVGAANDSDPNNSYYRQANNTLNNSAVWRTADGKTFDAVTTPTSLNGSVLGKTWLQTIRDLQPDVVVMNFMLNEDALKNPSTDPLGLYQSYKKIIEAMQGWSKRPAIIIGTSHTGAGTTPRSVMLECGRIIRALARQYKIELFDGQREYEILTRGTDITNPEPHHEAGLRYNGGLSSSGFSLDTTTNWYQLPGGVAASSPTGSTFRGDTTGSWQFWRKRLTSDCHIQMPWTISTSNPRPEIYYRTIPTISSISADRYLVRLNGANVELASYDNSTLRIIASAPLDIPVANGNVYFVDVVVEGARHRVTVNGKTYIDVYDFTHMREGWIGFGQAASGQNASVKVGTNMSDGVVFEFFDAKIVNASPVYTDADLMGPANDFLTNPDSVGGNTSVHPTTKAIGLIFDDTITRMCRDMRAKAGI